MFANPFAYFKGLTGCTGKAKSGDVSIMDSSGVEQG